MVTSSEFTQWIESRMLKTARTGRPFAILILRFGHLEHYRKRRSSTVITQLYQEMFQALRHSIHISQYVGMTPEGFALGFDVVDLGQLDRMTKMLKAVAQNVLRQGGYNDLSSEWSDVVTQFLWPNNQSFLYPQIGWAIYPRDGTRPTDLLQRAMHHAIESSR